MDFMANNGRGLEQALFFQWQPVDARRQDSLYRRWHLDGSERLRQAIRPPCANQDAGFHQSAHTFFQEERVASGALDEELFEGNETGIVPEQCL
jgi:hypothetical protein